MASGLSSPLGIAGVLLIIIGIILAIVGVILLIANQNRPKEWYIWLLLIGGVVLGIIGGILLAVALSQTPTVIPEETTMEPETKTIRYVVAQPQIETTVEPKTIRYVTTQPTKYVTTMPQHKMIDTHTEIVGQETFDPDPETVVYETSPPPRRVVAKGPYGPGGQVKEVTGVYRPQAKRTYVTTDIAEHPVTMITE